MIKALNIMRNIWKAVQMTIRAYNYKTKCAVAGRDTQCKISTP